jgi:hypothetical protein
VTAAILRRPLDSWLPCTGTICRWAAVGLWLVVASGVLMSVLLWANAGFPAQPLAFAQGIGGVGAVMAVALVYASLGAILAIRVPRNPTGWLLLAIGMVSGLVLPVNLLVLDALQSLRPAPAITLGAAWLLSAMAVPVVVSLLVVVCLIFPTGSLPSPRWRPVATLGTSGASLMGLSAALDPHGLHWYPALPNLLSVPVGLGPLLDAARAAGIGLVVLSLGLAAGSLAHRYRCADEVLRQQLKLIVYAGIVMAAAVVPFLLALHAPMGGPTDTELLLVAAAAGTCLFPVAVGFAISRHQLFGSQAAITRSIVYLPLVAISGGLFVSTVALVQRLFVSTTGTTSDIAIVVATLFAATAMTTVRRAIDGFADRRLRPAPAPPAAVEAPGSGTSERSEGGAAGSAGSPGQGREDHGCERILAQLDRLEARLVELERRTLEPAPASRRRPQGAQDGRPAKRPRDRTAPAAPDPHAVPR